jgi:hypothetical protein
MATITDLRARREALAAQRASGVARVSYDGKTVDYRSVAEIDRAIEALVIADPVPEAGQDGPEGTEDQFDAAAPATTDDSAATGRPPSPDPVAADIDPTAIRHDTIAHGHLPRG